MESPSPFSAHLPLTLGNRFIYFLHLWVQVRSVEFILSVVSNSLRRHEMRQVRPHCPSTAPGVYSNSYPLLRDDIQLSHPRHPLPLLPSIFPSIRVYSNESVLCIRWPKYWSFSFSWNIFQWYLGLISFKMDWLDPLAVLRTLKSLSQHQGSKASISCLSAFFKSNSHIHTWLLEKP